MAKFKKGQPSANPSGRPKGVVNNTTKMDLLLKNFSDKHGYDAKEKLFETILSQALNDNCTQSQNLIVSRLIPVAKPTTENVLINRLPKDLLKRGEKINALILSGELSPSVGKELLDGIVALMKISEASSLAKRVDALENNEPIKQSH